MIALLTTIPASRMAPISTTMLIVTPNSHRVPSSPISASGTLNRMTNGCSSDSNWLAMTR